MCSMHCFVHSSAYVCTECPTFFPLFGLGNLLLLLETFTRRIFGISWHGLLRNLPHRLVQCYQFRSFQPLTLIVPCFNESMTATTRLQTHSMSPVIFVYFHEYLPSKIVSVRLQTKCFLFFCHERGQTQRRICVQSHYPFTVYHHYSEVIEVIIT